MIFLPKLFYTVIFIFVVFGLVWFPVNGDFGLLKESEIHQKSGDQHQSVSDSGFDINIFKIDPIGLDIHLNLPRNKVANNSDIIAKPRFIVNSRSLRAPDPFNELGTIKSTPSQPAAKLMSRSEPTENKINIFGNTIIKNLRSSNSPPQAYAGTKYVLEACQLKSYSPERYEYFKNEVFRGKEYIPENEAVAASQNLTVGGFSRFDDESKYQSRNGNDCSYQIELVNCQQSIHRVGEASLAQRKLAHHSTRASTNPQYIPELSILSNPWNSGIAKVAKNNNPRLLNNSESLSSWDGTRTVRESITGEFSTGLKRLSIMPQVYAAEREKSPVIPLSLYQPLAGQIMFREALEKLPVEERTPEKIAELITGISQLLSNLPAKGEIFASGGKFSGLTGTAGILSGKVVKGTYRIKIDPVEGVDLIVPATVEAGLHGPETVMIGLTPGKGKVKIAGELKWWEKPMIKLGEWLLKSNKLTNEQTDKQDGGVVLAAETEASLPTAALTIQLFRDENKNGVYDSGESLVEWAGVKMDLEPTTQSFSYNLTEGWNLIAFPVTLTSVTTAAEAVADIAKEGGYVTTISTWNGDKWIEYSQRGAEKFGHDFGLAPGRAYFLESQMNSVWTVAGRPVEADKLIFDLSSGWNGVGILKEGMTAVKVMDEIQMAGEVSQTSPCEVCETADQMAKWNFGLWDVVVKRRYSPEHHEVYGRDFPIKNTEGYFLHLNQDTKLKFQ